MSTETDNLENKAEHHRARVDSTLDELRDRLSVGQLVDEAWSQLREGAGGDALKNIGRQARDNPLALGLIGAGLVWLLAGEGIRAEGREVKRRFDEWSDDPLDDQAHGDFRPPSERYRSAPPGSGDYVSGLRPRGKFAPGNDDSADGPGVVDKAKERASSLADRASDATSQAGDAISDAAGRISGAADSVAGTARQVGRSASDTAAASVEGVRHYGAEASEAARQAYDEAGRYGRYVRRDLYGRGQRLRRSFLDTLYEEPLIVGGVALAVGTAIGVSLPSTRHEDELLGPARDDLRDAAYAYGEDVAERAGHVAEKAYEAASDEADDKGLMPESSGETLAEKASDVVDKAVDEAKTEAKKQGLT